MTIGTGNVKHIDNCESLGLVKQSSAAHARKVYNNEA